MDPGEPSQVCQRDLYWWEILSQETSEECPQGYPLASTHTHITCACTLVHTQTCTHIETTQSQDASSSGAVRAVCVSLSDAEQKYHRLNLTTLIWGSLPMVGSVGTTLNRTNSRIIKLSEKCNSQVFKENQNSGGTFHTKDFELRKMFSLRSQMTSGPHVLIVFLLAANTFTG